MAIARALAQEPDIILADEPTGNLDSETGEEIMTIFDSLHADGQTIIVVTHEEHIAARCGRVVRLKDGIIESDVKTLNAARHETPNRTPRISLKEAEDLAREMMGVWLDDRAHNRTQ